MLNASPQLLELPERVYAHGFSLRKRGLLRCFAAPAAVHFVTHGRRLPPGSTLLLWGSQAVPVGIGEQCRVLRIEDGFLRSVGLGVDLIRPLSWVMDGRGIYYDATRPSDLEHQLQTLDFPPPLLARAAALRRRLVACGITKYSAGRGSWQRPAHVAQVILVPGQVATDGSLRLGAPGIRSNISLLRAVRAANPSGYVLYKPHPDVSAGLRAPGEGDGLAALWCDEIVTDVPMGELLRQVDEVHVLTSLSGFEALLRRKIVVCYGLPFYAGWGLTRDILSITRRTRRLTLDELVAGALITYPRYVSRANSGPSTAEAAVDELLAWRAEVASRRRPWQGLWRSVLRAAVGCP